MIYKEGQIIPEYLHGAKVKILHAPHKGEEGILVKCSSRTWYAFGNEANGDIPEDKKEFKKYCEKYNKKFSYRMSKLGADNLANDYSFEVTEQPNSEMFPIH